MLQWINLNESKFQTLLHVLWRLCEEIDRWWENELVFKIPETNIPESFLASKYDNKKHSDLLKNNLIHLWRFIKQYITAIENIFSF